MRNSVIIVAGGTGSRMGSDLPKQFMLLGAYPVLMWTIQCFRQFDPKILVVVVLPETEIGFWKDLCLKYALHTPHVVTAGGKTRFHSVRNGLDTLQKTDLVAIHDGVRPLVSRQTISKCFDQAAETGAAIPVLPVNETLRTGTMAQSETVDRSNFFAVQTPQVFRWQILKDAYAQDWDASFTDDASVVEKSGCRVTMVPGERDNIKITYQEDLMVAETFLKKKEGTR